MHRLVSILSVAVVAGGLLLPATASAQQPVAAAAERHSEALWAATVAAGAVAGALVGAVVTDGLIVPAYVYATAGRMGAQVAGAGAGGAMVPAAGVGTGLVQTGGAMMQAAAGMPAWAAHSGYGALRGIMMLFGGVVGGFTADAVYR